MELVVPFCGQILVCDTASFFLVSISSGDQSSPQFSNKGKLKEEVKRVEISSTEFTVPIVGAKELASESFGRNLSRCCSSLRKLEGLSINGLFGKFPEYLAEIFIPFILAS